ncbi:phage tail protein [Latilactobacillus curvatus]|uniref:phage tail protein n=1 Tax=Latilactobacillus curvatus TaxID=28038 RepID=UPI0022F3D815|nr:phage tail protein [Latilactobacillus curvatus]WBY48102.1 phage tail protein [Latilactobacillus curvatus]
MVETFTEFDEYKVTNASIQWYDGKAYTPGVALGCTGKLELETEMKTVTKKCEGDEVRHVDIPTQVKGTWTGHLPVENLRKVWGLATDGLKEGIFAYGTGSRQGRGILTFEVLDLDEQVHMMRAFANMQFSGGLKWELENGSEEIAEIEQEFISMKDSNNKFFYEALTNELKDETLVKDWLTKFSPDMALTSATPSDTQKLSKGGK